VIRFERDQQAAIEWVKECGSRGLSHSRAIPLREMEKWAVVSGQLRHQSGRFFSIGGFEYTNSTRAFAQPLINQPEIGTLGFLLRSAEDGLEFLMQAKYEPGNVNGVQIAPTVQATRSNLDRVHGGGHIPFAEYFADQEVPTEFDILQTEEADRFFRKRNRNVARVIDRCDHNQSYRWCGIETIKALLRLSHIVNADARSGLACCDWKAFFRPSGHPHFFLDCVDLTRLLWESLETTPEKAELGERVGRIRAGFGQVKEVPLDALPGWHMDENGCHPETEGQFSVKYYTVTAESREVRDWSQPLLTSHGVGLSVLALSAQSGVLKLFVRLRHAIGVWNGVEVAPSYFRSPGELWSPREGSDCRLFRAIASGRLLLEAENAEEGSRFYKDVILFRVVMVDAANMEDAPDGIWITLGTAKEVVDQGQLASNELRSALSFLIPLL